MEYDKINNLLGSESEQLSKFVNREYVRVNSLSNPYNENKSIRFKTPMLRSNLCYYADAYILVNGTITVTTEDADDLDIVIPMYNLLEYSKNYKKTIGSLYNYYRDELSDDADNNNFDNIKVVNSNAFKYKNKITGNTYDILNTADDYVAVKEGTQEIELAIPLKYLGNFWRALNTSLISCEISLELKWNKNCVILV